MHFKVIAVLIVTVAIAVFKLSTEHCLKDQLYQEL